MKQGYVRKRKVPAWELGCARCDHEWVALITREKPDPPARCANCKSPNYLVPVGELPLGRPKKTKAQ